MDSASSGSLPFHDRDFWKPFQRETLPPADAPNCDFLFNQSLTELPVPPVPSNSEEAKALDDPGTLLHQLWFVSIFIPALDSFRESATAGRSQDVGLFRTVSFARNPRQ